MRILALDGIHADGLTLFRNEGWTVETAEPIKDPRPEACTAQYDPVCATRDTGIRCITAPCPSSEQKTMGNACTACSDPKVSGWVKGECPAQ